MPEDERPEKIRWDTDFKRRVVGGVVSGLIVLIIAAVAGVIIAQVASLSAGDALLYVGVPVLTVVLLLLAVVVIRAQRQRAAARETWEANISHHTIQLINVVRRLILKDLIQTAHAWEWTIGENDDDDLVFVAPDDEAFIVVDASDREVAERLHEAAPDHFPETWQDFTYRANATADVAEQEVERLTARLAALERDTPVETARATLAMMAAEASARGWEVNWLDDRAEFVNGKRGQLATVHYGAIDLVKLRKALGLSRPMDNW
jgi:hypothetical protein